LLLSLIFCQTYFSFPLYLWWSHCVFLIYSSYLSPSFIIVFILSASLSFFPLSLPLLEWKSPSCWGPGTYCVYFPLSIDTLCNICSAEPFITRLVEKTFLSLGK
jgi:hypothetical protein